MNRNRFFINILTLLPLLYGGCDMARSDGHIEVYLLNFQREGARTVEVTVEGDHGALTESLDLDTFRRDSVSMTGLRVGSYIATATSFDKDGEAVQLGLSAPFSISEGEIVEVPTAMVELDYSDPCSEGKTRCEIVPGFDLVMGCRDGHLWRPEENCGDDARCEDGACVDGVPHYPVTCEGDEGVELQELGIDVCDPSNEFTTHITHPYFPLVVGSRHTLEGEDDEDEEIAIDVEVLEEEALIDGVYTRVVEEVETEEGVFQKRERTYYAQAADGTVCFFGEEVWGFDDIEYKVEEKSWTSDHENHLYPGIMMPAEPLVGMMYSQQLAPGVALDRGRVILIGEPIVVSAGTFTDTVWVLESSPIDDGETSLKVYAREVGLVLDEQIELVEM